MTEHEHEEQQAEAKRENARVSLYLGLAAIVISLLIGGGVYLELREQTNETRRIAGDVKAVQTERTKAARAANQDQVDQCFARNAQGPALVRVLIAFRDQLTDEEARATVQDYIVQISEGAPTIRECNALAERLGLPARRPTVPR